MKTTASVLSHDLLDVATGVMSLPALALFAAGLAVLFGLALIGGVGLRALRAPARLATHSLSGPHRVASATHDHH